MNRSIDAREIEVGRTETLRSSEIFWRKPIAIEVEVVPGVDVEFVAKVFKVSNSWRDLVGKVILYQSELIEEDSRLLEKEVAETSILVRVKGIRESKNREVCKFDF